MHPTRPDHEDLPPGHCTRGPHDNPRAATGVPPDAAEHRDSYPPWPVVGLLSPFLLALPLYPLLWLPISAVADALWALLAAIFGLFGARGNPTAGKGAAPPGGPADPAFWEFGPLISPPVALTSAAAVLLAWFVLSGMVGKRRWWYPERAAKRGFRAGLPLGTSGRSSGSPSSPNSCSPSDGPTAPWRRLEGWSPIRSILGASRVKHKPRRGPLGPRPHKSPRRSRDRRARRRHGDNGAMTERRNLERLRRRQDRHLDRRLLRDGDDPPP